MTESKLLGLRSTMEQIMKLHFFHDAARTQKPFLTVVFVDYGKAFDSVDRRAIRSSWGTTAFLTRCR